jgi:hypothetical protein
MAHAAMVRSASKARIPARLGIAECVGSSATGGSVDVATVHASVADADCVSSGTGDSAVGEAVG